MTGLRLEDLTAPEVLAAIGRSTPVLLPAGATEQHGPHLPLATDTILAHALCAAVASRIDGIVAPSVSYGCRSRPRTGGGEPRAGTMSVRATTFMALVRDVVEALAGQGFRRIAVLSWHFENQGFLHEAVCEAVERTAQDTRVAVFEVPFGDLSPATMELVYPDGFPGWDVEHAGILETSLMLHLHPELVRLDRAVDDAAPTSRWYDVLPTPDDAAPASGVLWKATQGTREKGAAAWPEIVDGLVEALGRDLGP